MQSRSKHPGAVLTGMLLALLLGLAGIFPDRPAAHTHQDEKLPDVGVDERLGARLPLDLIFTDQEGKRVRLGDYFTGGPVVLTINYYTCPMLCPLIFKNLSDTVNRLAGLSLAHDFRIVTVSVNPEESVAMARAKASETWRMLRGVEGPETRWPFLIGGQEEIGRLTRAVGVRYIRLEKDNFAHPAVFIVITPSGQVARYLFGLEQSTADLKLALIEAAGGKIGGAPLLSRALLYCYHYDPVEKKYALAAMNVMKIAGGGVLLLVGILLISLWGAGRRKGGAGQEKPGGRG